MRRAYVGVVAMHMADGKIIPQAIIWEDGIRYEIDRVLDARQAASTKVGGQGIRYTLRIKGRETYLFHDVDRWFVEAKN